MKSVGGYIGSNAQETVAASPKSVRGMATVADHCEVGGVWLRSLLTTAGASKKQVALYGTHSCKATTLSWLAKAG